MAGSLLHGDEVIVHGDAGYRGIARWCDTPPGSTEAVAKRAKASVRAKVAHPFRVITRQFGHMKARYRGLAKNTAQLTTLFALSNLWMVRHTLQVG